MIYSSLESVDNRFVTAIVEMPSGTKHKYEQDKDTNLLKLDRVLPVPVPFNYGYVINTLSEDGDPTDIFIVSMEPIPPLTKVTVELVGLIKCIDAEKEDDKLIGFIKNDKKTKSLFSIEKVENKIIRYLNTYKEEMSVVGILDANAATKRIEQAYSLFFSKA